MASGTQRGRACEADGWTKEVLPTVKVALGRLQFDLASRLLQADAVLLGLQEIERTTRWTVGRHTLDGGAGTDACANGEELIDSRAPDA
ncbi:MAG TPA: hypothetical protein VF195_00370 [Actinomycetota bacterium]